MSTSVNLGGEPNVQQRRFKDSGPDDESSQQQQQQVPAAPLSMASTVGAYVFQTGKQRAQQALNIYSHIDYLRPYFDVEPKDVLNRSLNSLRCLFIHSNRRLLFIFQTPLFSCTGRTIKYGKKLNFIYNFSKITLLNKYFYKNLIGVYKLTELKGFSHGTLWSSNDSVHPLRHFNLPDETRQSRNCNEQ